jgi:hypothetical protein
LGLFDQHLCEVQYEGVRYVLRRNPVRAQEMASTRASKLAALQALATEQQNRLEVRPVFVRTEAGTRGHVLVVMLSYMLVRELKRAWKDFDLTVEEGLDELNRICAMELSVAGMDAVLRLPEPSPLAKQLLGSLQVNLPPVLHRSKVVVDTKKKLPTRRKNV